MKYLFVILPAVLLYSSSVLANVFANTFFGKDDLGQDCSISLSQSHGTDAWAIAQVNYIRLPFQLYRANGGFKSVAETTDMNFELFYDHSKQFFVFSASKLDNSETWSDFGFTRVCQLNSN